MSIFDVYDQSGQQLDHTESAKSDGTTDVLLSNLTPNTNYSGYGITYAGKTDKTVIPDFKTNDEVASAPTLTATAGDGSASVTLADGSNLGSAITDRVVYWSDGTNTGTTDLKDALTGSISGLTNGTEYTLQATVKNGAGESSKSQAVKVTPVAV